MGMGQSMGLCIGCMEGNQLKAGQTGTVALKCWWDGSSISLFLRKKKLILIY